MNTEILKSLTQILNDVEDLYSCDIKEHVIKHAIQNVPNFPTRLLMDSINAELTRLSMSYYITGYCGTRDYGTHEADPLFACTINLNPDKFNWNEIVRVDDRGEAVYQKLLEPFKNANVIFPSTLKDARKLFKLDSIDDWNLGTYRDWLIGINKSFYPHECNVIMKKLMALTIKA